MLDVSTEQLEFGTLAAQVLNLGKGARVDSEQYCAGDRLHVRGVKDMAKPRWFGGKESAANVGDAGFIPVSGDSLEREMATHSSILAWRIPWTEEPAWL